MNAGSGLAAQLFDLSYFLLQPNTNGFVKMVRRRYVNCVRTLDRVVTLTHCFNITSLGNDQHGQLLTALSSLSAKVPTGQDCLPARRGRGRAAAGLQVWAVTPNCSRDTDTGG